VITELLEILGRGFARVAVICGVLVLPMWWLVYWMDRDHPVVAIIPIVLGVCFALGASDN
jgi:hypothetical protein